MIKREIYLRFFVLLSNKFLPLMIKNESPEEDIYASCVFVSGERMPMHKIPPLQTFFIQCDKGVGKMYFYDKDKNLIWEGVAPVCGGPGLSVYPHAKKVSYDGCDIPSLRTETFEQKVVEQKNSNSRFCYFLLFFLVLLAAVLVYVLVSRNF